MRIISQANAGRRRQAYSLQMLHFMGDDAAGVAVKGLISDR